MLEYKYQLKVLFWRIETSQTCPGGDLNSILKGSPSPPAAVDDDKVFICENGNKLINNEL